MNKKSLLLVLGAFGIAGILGLTFYVNSSLAPESSSASVATVPATCMKTGINYAGGIGGEDYNSYNTQAKKYNMGFTMELATQPDQLTSLSNSMNNALDKGLTPIVRICHANANDCGFKDPTTYVTFLNQLSTALKNRVFYALSGPNEPLSERWITGLENTVYPFSTTDFDLIAKKTADYMNAVTSRITKTNIKLLSPAFNLTEPDFEKFAAKLKSSGVNFAKIVGIAGNAYNVKDYTVNNVKRETITSFVARLKAVFPSNDIFLTEIGMFESSKNPNWTGTKVDPTAAKANLASEIVKLKADVKVKAFLLFDSFGNNRDPNFDYNVLVDTDYPTILSSACYSVPAPPPVVKTLPPAPKPLPTPVPATTLDCPSAVIPRFRIVQGTTDLGLSQTGTFDLSKVTKLEYTVLTNAQTNPPQYFVGNISIKSSNGFATQTSGQSTPKIIPAPTEGVYTLYVNYNGKLCAGASIELKTLTLPPVSQLDCPADFQARFRVVQNGKDLGLIQSGTYNASDITTLEYTVVANAQTNPPQYYSSTVRVSSNNGFVFESSGPATPKAVATIKPGFYTLSVNVKGKLCSGAVIELK